MKAALRLLLAPYRFSVDRLFRMGEVGWAHWFDSPSLYPGGNHLYLYQDNAGTTPVTAVGDTIGLSVRRAGTLNLSQATGTARPTLSARVNLLLSTGSFAAAAWTRRGTATVGAAAPDGTGELLAGIGALSAGDVFQQKAAVTGAAYKPYVEIWPVSTSGTLVFCNPQGLPYGQWNINMALLSTGQWNVITSSHPAVTVVNNYSGNASLAGVMFYASSGAPLSFYARRPDIRTADDAAKNIPAYQRVGATAADHDTDGFPHGQYPDGTDDNQTTTTGGGGTTGFFYCGAITVSGGAGTARTIWSDTGTNTGYRVRINSSNKLELAAGNGTAYTTVQSNETVTAPGTYLLSAWDDGGVLAVQVNNFAPATTTRPTVSAGTAAITVYKDNGAASSYFNGRDYGSVYRQSYIGESQHARLKRWLADRARITL